jgi:hypothetical protein
MRSLPLDRTHNIPAPLIHDLTILRKYSGLSNCLCYCPQNAVCIQLNHLSVTCLMSFVLKDCRVFVLVFIFPHPVFYLSLGHNAINELEILSSILPSEHSLFRKILF